MLNFDKGGSFVGCLVGSVWGRRQHAHEHEERDHGYCLLAAPNPPPPPIDFTTAENQF